MVNIERNFEENKTRTYHLHLFFVYLAHEDITFYCSMISKTQRTGKFSQISKPSFTVFFSYFSGMGPNIF